uniref:SAM domain-containing protein n=1 Tax=Lutzomyia longipalpis TaxID=7200 RepID=A0A1B0CQ92_LUTLO
MVSGGTLTWSTFLNYFVIGHLIPNFENARIELSHFWEMTTQEFEDIGITNGRELAILAKIQYSYTGENHYMRR